MHAACTMYSVAGNFSMVQILSALTDDWHTIKVKTTKEPESLLESEKQNKPPPEEAL